MLNEFIPLTQEEFEKISAIVQESYKLENTKHEVFRYMIRLVDGEPYAKNLQARRHSNTAAEHVRELLWNMFTGGGMSANVTRKAFKAIGRESECNPDWI